MIQSHKTVFDTKGWVLFTLDSFDTGGVVTVTKLHTQILIDYGIPVLIVGRKGDIADPRKVFQKCKVIVIPNKVRTTFMGRILDTFSYVSYLTHLYKKYKILYLHFNQTWSSLYTLLHPSTVNKKRIATFHGAYDLENRDYSTGLLADIANKLRKKAQHFVLNKCDGVIVLSYYSKHLVLSHFSFNQEEKIRVISGCV